MRNRIRATGTALALGVALATFGATGVALAGEPTTVTVPVPGPTQTVEVPGPTQTVETPAPTQTVEVPGPTKTQTVTVPAPTRKASETSGSGSGSSSSAATETSSPATTPVANTETSVDTGTVPQGGVQAGAGGTAIGGGTPALLTVLLGLLAFGITSAGVVMRRRAAAH